MDKAVADNLTREILQTVAEMNATWERVGRARQGRNRRVVQCSRVTTTLHWAGKLREFIGPYEWAHSHQIQDAHHKVTDLLDQLPALQRHPTKPLLWLLRD